MANFCFGSLTSTFWHANWPFLPKAFFRRLVSSNFLEWISRAWNIYLAGMINAFVDLRFKRKCRFESMYHYVSMIGVFKSYTRDVGEAFG